MEWIIAVTGALISAIVGGFFGHHMTVRLFKIRVNKQEDALYLELKLIFDKYKRDLINKYNDYQCKFRQELMLSVPSVDYSLIDALTLELASSHKVLNQDARSLIVNLKKLTQNLDNLSLQRMENFKFENDHDEFLKITKRILVSEIQIFFIPLSLLMIKRSLNLVNIIYQKWQKYLVSYQVYLLTIMYGKKFYQIELMRKHNKRFKRDFQRAAFLLCVGFCGYGVMRKLGSSVVSPLSGRYVYRR
ncbi:hypothetical protein [Vibrio metschnikovii]|uniref:hypothetical protein n=1 Tax=Vibrio metschnikovii TaxID=28172 RepID=UPI0027E453B6|nr:hypothetical protein [Vibrio metschnikovii]